MRTPLTYWPLLLLVGLGLSPKPELQAQTPLLTDPSNVWNVDYHSTSGVQRAILRFDGDTVIDGLQYRILRVPAFFNGRVPVLSVILLREEGAKTFYRSAEYEGERLLYDFDLVAGDTLKRPTQPQQGCITVVDSVFSYRPPAGTLLRGQYITESSPGEGSYTDILIEGIGSLQGPTGYRECRIFILDTYQELVCFAQGDTRYYPARGAAACQTSSLSDATISSDLTIWPSFASDRLWVASTDFQPITYEILTVVGACVVRAVLPQGEPLTVSALASGQYLIVFHDREGRQVVRRFVK